MATGMNAASNIIIRRNRDNASSVVEWKADGASYSRTLAGRPSRAAMFARGLTAGSIRTNRFGQLRYRSWDRQGNERWTSIPE
jgi:hypothetical protein